LVEGVDGASEESGGAVVGLGCDEQAVLNVRGVLVRFELEVYTRD
jgi:hypothetical protein